MLKSLVEDLKQTQTIVDNISNTNILIDGGTGALTDDTVNSLRTAISGLSEDQAKLVLSTKNLTQEQIKQVLAEKQLTASQISERLATELNSEADAKALLLGSGIVTQKELEEDASIKVSAATLNEAIEKGALSVADANVIAGALGITGVNAGQASSFDLVTAAIARNIKMMGKWLVTTPAGWATMIVTGILLVGTLIEAHVKSTEEYREELKNLKSEASEIESELSSLNTELTTTKERLDELSKKDSLTFTEKEEYDNLVKQNNELQRKIDLLELEQETKNREKNKAFIDAMNSDVQSKSEYSKDSSGYVSKGNASLRGVLVGLSGQTETYSMASEEEYIKQQFARRKELLEKYSEASTKEERAILEKQINDIDAYLQSKNKQWKTDSEGISYILNPKDDQDQAVNAWLDYIADFQDRMAIEMGGTNAKTNAFNRLIDNWYFDEKVQELQDFGEAGQVTANMLDNSKYDEFIDKLVEIGVVDSADNLDEIASAFNNLAEAADNANSKVKTNVDILSGIESLSTGLDQLKEIYSDVLDGKEFDFSSILNNEDFKKSFGDYKEEYENFISTITSSPNDITACQSAFNSLASAYINNKTALEDVTEETKEATIAMLRQMGVANAKDVVEAKLLNKAKELAAQEEFLAQVGKKLEKATFEEIEAFLNQDDVLEETKAQIRKFAMEKYNANNVHLSTATDIANLKGLVKGLGGATKALDILNKLKSGEKINFGGKDGYDYIVKQAQAEVDAAYSILNEQTEVNVDLKFDGGDSAEKVKETYDWIETLLSRIQRTITNLGKKVSATYRTWIDRNNAVKDSIAELNKEYQKQGEAAAYYENKAKSVGLNEAYAKKVREGDMSVQDNVTDEALKEKIQKYQEYYEKYLAAVDREEDILAELASNYQQAFDLIASEYDAKIGVIEHDKSMIDGMISQAETSGYIVSKAYYEAMIKAEEGNYAALIDKRNKLQNYLSQAVKNGTIKEGTQDWYDMQASINEVNQAIQDSNTSIIEFGNNIRETEWELFDMERDYVENIRDEISFFIDLMDSGKLFDEKGNMTSLGEATAGLHTVSYNTYLADAEAYAEEILDINKQIAEDQYNKDLLERREELLELQRESILAAQDEKEAIKDMISDGYDVFLDYLQEVIDNRKEAMNEISDLQDFEKSIAEQTSTIADYKKQLAAFEGDDSEETQAKVQQLRISLEEAEKALAESEYEQWKKDQTQMLDSLYDETQSWINERLDNIDGLVQEVVDSTNIKADEIKQTLTQEAENVGISLSDSLSSIWSNDNGNNVVSTNIADATTTVNTTLLSIAGYLEGIAEHLGVEAKTQVNADSNNAGNTNSSSNGGTTAVAPTTGNNNTQSSTVATTWGSWFIEKAFNGSDKSLNIDTSIVDRLKWKDKDSSFSARAQYYSAMGGKGTYTGSASQNTWMLSEMKKNGFSKGGTIGSLIQGAGEDGFVLARTGEEILSIEKIRELRGAFEAMTPVIDNLKPMVVPTLRNNNNTNTINDLHVGFTLPGVNNYEDFVSKIQSDTRFGKIIDQMVFGKMRGDNSLSKYKY